ncbi:MAG: MoxR family ATPase [Akkermansia sp.]|nr:MoxR family ATPase [Akkermansia sp.]
MRFMTPSPEETWQELQSSIREIRTETARVIVGQEDVVEQMLAALLCRGHCLLVGVPGLAKTLLVSTLGRVLGLNFRRIQFTPDLMPTDIVGSEILQGSAEGTRRFEFVPGPVFTNLLLADEINRTPPKTQAALLEAMQEKQVTVAGTTRNLSEPFVVYATQNPVEHEGTYPLPEAQLDRFFFQINIGYPTAGEEEEILRRTGGLSMPEPKALLTAEKVQQMQRIVADVPVPDDVYSLIVRLVQSTRPENPQAPDMVKKYVACGAGPRAGQCLLAAARAMAMLRGRVSVSPAEVKSVLHPVLRHRLMPNYAATGEGVSMERVIDSLM